LLEPVPLEAWLVETACINFDPKTLGELDEGDVVGQLIGHRDRDTVRRCVRRELASASEQVGQSLSPRHRRSSSMAFVERCIKQLGVHEHDCPTVAPEGGVHQGQTALWWLHRGGWGPTQSSGELSRACRSLVEARSRIGWSSPGALASNPRACRFEPNGRRVGRAQPERSARREWVERPWFHGLPSGTLKKLEEDR
jgi:hypothetical protein